MDKHLHIPDHFRVQPARYWLNEFDVFRNHLPLSLSIQDEVIQEFKLQRPPFSLDHLLEALDNHLQGDKYKRRCKPNVQRYCLNGEPAEGLAQSSLISGKNRG